MNIGKEGEREENQEIKRRREGKRRKERELKREISVFRTEKEGPKGSLLLRKAKEKT